MTVASNIPERDGVPEITPSVGIQDKTTGKTRSREGEGWSSGVYIVTERLIGIRGEDQFRGNGIWTNHGSIVGRKRRNWLSGCRKLAFDPSIRSGIFDAS